MCTREQVNVDKFQNQIMQSAITLRKLLHNGRPAFTVGSPCHLDEVTTASGGPYGCSRQTGSSTSAQSAGSPYETWLTPYLLVTYLEKWTEEVQYEHKFNIFYLSIVSHGKNNNNNTNVCLYFWLKGRLIILLFIIPSLLLFHIFIRLRLSQWYTSWWYSLILIKQSTRWNSSCRAHSNH